VKYTIAAHPTRYAGVRFRSRLEARWAAFFDLVGWNWAYEPIDLAGWTPDFRVSFKCDHSECGGFVSGEAMRDGEHVLYVEVKPFETIDAFVGHPAYAGIGDGDGESWDPPHSACFGLNPEVTQWSSAHGSCGGVFSVTDFCGDWDVAWREAGNRVQWNRR